MQEMDKHMKGFEREARFRVNLTLSYGLKPTITIQSTPSSQ